MAMSSVVMHVRPWTHSYIKLRVPVRYRWKDPIFEPDLQTRGLAMPRAVMKADAKGYAAVPVVNLSKRLLPLPRRLSVGQFSSLLLFELKGRKFRIAMSPHGRMIHWISS